MFDFFVPSIINEHLCIIVHCYGVLFLISNWISYVLMGVLNGQIKSFSNGNINYNRKKYVRWVEICH